MVVTLDAHGSLWGPPAKLRFAEAEKVVRDGQLRSSIYHPFAFIEAEGFRVRLNPVQNDQAQLSGQYEIVQQIVSHDTLAAQIMWTRGDKTWTAQSGSFDVEIDGPQMTATFALELAQSSETPQLRGQLQGPWVIHCQQRGTELGDDGFRVLIDDPSLQSDYCAHLSQISTERGPEQPTSLPEPTLRRSDSPEAEAPEAEAPEAEAPAEQQKDRSRSKMSVAKGKGKAAYTWPDQGTGIGGLIGSQGIAKAGEDGADEDVSGELLGNPIVLGSIPQSAVEAVFRRHQDQIQACYTNALEQEPSLSGKVVVKLIIASSGQVDKVTVKSSTLNSTAVEQCVVDLLNPLQFPDSAATGITIASYPLRFHPS
ncbi:MAG TPA: hypothetical protein DFR83_00010 [Deltaproteobacteria bacterium]|nr:hypothetical protein [Deltaproteobacteria bacterium]